MIGKTLGGYRILEQVGMGGMATIWKAYDPGTDRVVALKTLPPQYSTDPMFRARFEQEAHAIARLEHLHILPVFAYGDEDGIAYMAMRYLDTGTLSNLISNRTLPFHEITHLLEQIASALDYAHQHGILHRDVKPSNILIDKDGNAYLTDFGIAKMTEGGLGLTGSLLIGTPQYMSPEQCMGAEDLSAASDQYSLGVVLYEMITGRTPYEAETPVAIIQKHMIGEELPLPSIIRTDLPQAAENVLLKVLAHDPKNRYENCTLFASAFAAALKEIPTQALTQKRVEPSTPTRLEMPNLPPAKSRLLPIVGGITLLLLLFIVIGLLLSQSNDNNEVTATSAPATPDSNSDWLGGASQFSFLTACGPVGNHFCIVDEYNQPLQEIDPELPEGYFDIQSINWSRDGEFAIFVVRSTHQNQLVRYDFADSKLTLLTDGERNDTYAVMSPNDRMIIFHSNCETHILQTDGQERYVLLPYSVEFCPDLYRWSPDGQAVAILANSPNMGEPTERRVYLLWNGDPGTLTQILVSPVAGMNEPYNLVWSPDTTALLVSLGDRITRIEMGCLSSGCTDYPSSVFEGVIPAQWQPNVNPHWTEQTGF